MTAAVERAARDLQLRLVGRWSGRARLWLAPGKATHDEPVVARNIWQIAWVDGFHASSSGVMISEGAFAEAAGKVGALGSHEAGAGPRWGWRTEYEATEGGLVVRHFNRTPDDEETLAVQFDYEPS